MPREYIHWKVALEAHDELNRRYPQADLRQMDQDMLLLGAVAHDAPYFHRFGRGAFSSVSELLHGTPGNDTFEPLALICDAARHCPAQADLDHRAFLLGLLTHYCADVVLHPAVYYFTGNYYDPDPERARAARTQHRLFETYCDNHCAMLWPELARFSLHSIVTRLGVRVEMICDSLGRALPDSAQWLRSFFDFAICQRLFHNRSASAVMHALTRVFPHRLTELDALYNSGKRPRPECFETRFVYQNPIDGRSSSSNLEEFLQQAIEMAVALAERVIIGSSDWTETGLRLRAAKPGLSLNFGLPAAPAGTARHFSAAPSPFGG